jgi:hypothetical protein
MARKTKNKDAMNDLQARLNMKNHPNRNKKCRAQKLHPTFPLAQ